jgi:DNA-binding NarL/FixJ family response regulator
MRVNPKIRILILSGRGGEDQVRAAFERGAHGYMVKASTGAELVQAVRALNHCERYVSPRLAARLFMSTGQSHPDVAKPTDGLPHLTPREEQILSILSNGRSNKEIGNKLDLSEKTVKHHITNILQKLQVRNRVEAALLASDRVPQPTPDRKVLPQTRSPGSGFAN